MVAINKVTETERRLERLERATDLTVNALGQFQAGCQLICKQQDELTCLILAIGKLLQDKDLLTKEEVAERVDRYRSQLKEAHIEMEGVLSCLKK